jgi:hypothetical protein
MALLERVSTLIRANLNDLVDKAEDPEKMIKQVILDMENQLLQVKTQVAISIADEHVLEKKLKENEENDAAVDAAGGHGRGSARRRTGAHGGRARDDLPLDGGEFPAAGGRPEDAGGEPEGRAASSCNRSWWKRRPRATC